MRVSMDLARLGLGLVLRTPLLFFLVHISVRTEQPLFVVLTEAGTVISSYAMNEWPLVVCFSAGALDRSHRMVLKFSDVEVSRLYQFIGCQVIEVRELFSCTAVH